MALKLCGWCGLPKKLHWLHKGCIKIPNYHDQAGVDKWMKDPARPTKDLKVRELTEDERLKLADMLEDEY